MQASKFLTVRNLRDDKPAIDAALQRFSSAGHRRPRLEFHGPESARIVDEWGIVPEEIWVGWIFRFN